MPRLEERGLSGPHYAQREPFGLQLGENLARPVQRTVIGDGEPVQDAEVMAYESLDDIGLVAHHRYAEQTHAFGELITAAGTPCGDAHFFGGASVRRSRGCSGSLTSSASTAA